MQRKCTEWLCEPVSGWRGVANTRNHEYTQLIFIRKRNDSDQKKKEKKRVENKGVPLWAQKT